ncbi:MAG TPA: N-acetylmuramoyl-L-alanine amidase [Methylomirabilota bacterium]|nr:N-acetylmuramoyl-L-alanine amidase [Methylomirabilota bacterium]
MRLGISFAIVALVLVGAAPGGADLPTVMHEGRPYVELDRVAASMRTRLDATPSSIRAYLRVPGHVVTFTRNWAQVVVDGRPVVLDAPVRVKAGTWLVPETFVSRVLPRVAQAGPPAALPKTVVQTAAGGLEELRFRSYPSFTRVVLETSQPVTYRLEQSGPREARVRVVGLRSEPRTEEIRDGLVAEVRAERAGRDLLLRIVFESQPGEVKTLALLDPHRLVLDFLRPADETTRERVQAAPLRTIVLDAGHGGQDLGAVGPSGLTEKDLVLDITRRVAKLVEEQLKIKVLLTRDDDNFVTLRDRTTMANRARADLFVSIHANAHRHAVSGVETYFLSSEATDNAARQVAALENSVIELEAPAPRARPDFVKAILWDLAQSEFQVESSRLAEVVQDSMTQTLRIPNRGVKQAGFYVLGGAAMPAVLIEVGFVTHPQEERRLRDYRYRDEIARAIFAGLVEYKRHWDQRLRALVERGR